MTAPEESNPKNSPEPYRPMGRSSIAGYVAGLSPAERHGLAVDSYALAFIDGIVTGCSVLLEDADTALLERLARTMAPFIEYFEQDPTAVDVAIARLNDTDKTQAWAKQIQRSDHRAFLNRMLGSARYHQLLTALHHDGRTVLAAIRLGIESMKPYMLALADLIDHVPSGQRSALGFDNINATVATALISVERMLGFTLSDEERLIFPASEMASHWTPGPDEMQHLVEDLRTVVHARSSRELDELNGFFARKLKGASDALEHSADGVSQAANSLVELLDRMARKAFDEPEVLAWLNDNDLLDESTTYHHHDTGKVRPTKRGQFLCLAYLGGPTRILENEDEKSNAPWLIVGSVLTDVRNALQKLKHADTGSAKEADEVRSLLRAFEAAVYILCRVCWAFATDQSRERLTRAFSD